MNLQFPTALAQKVANIWNTSQSIADEGNLYIATNPTPGTTIATTTSVVDAGNSGATSAQTRPLMLIGNQYVPGDPLAKNIYPLSLRLRITQVPTSATRWSMAMWLDTITGAYTSGGSTIVPVNANWGTTAATRAQIIFGAITAAATTSNGRLVNNTTISTTIPVIGDEYLILFGGTDYTGTPTADSTIQRRIMLQAAPIVISAGSVLKIGMWGASNAAAPTFEFELNYAER